MCCLIFRKMSWGKRLKFHMFILGTVYWLGWDVKMQLRKLFIACICCIDVDLQVLVWLLNLSSMWAAPWGCCCLHWKPMFCCPGICSLIPRYGAGSFLNMSLPVGNFDSRMMPVWYVIGCLRVLLPQLSNRTVCLETRTTRTFGYSQHEVECWILFDFS